MGNLVSNMHWLWEEAEYPDKTHASSRRIWKLNTELLEFEIETSVSSILIRICYGVPLGYRLGPILFHLQMTPRSVYL